MKDHPMLFSGPLVRAILEGRKTQSRRLVTKATAFTGTGIRWDACDLSKAWVDPGLGAGAYLKAPATGDGFEIVDRIHCRVEIGDRIWCRETWHTDEVDLDFARSQHEDVVSLSPIYYRATAEPDAPDAGWIWRPSIHMPRWASRITLDVTDVRVERVQGISEEDARAEGTTGRDEFQEIWDSIYTKPGQRWGDNPWVWVYEFKVTNGESNE